jgi:hypothetical protein
MQPGLNAWVPEVAFVVAAFTKRVSGSMLPHVAQQTPRGQQHCFCERQNTTSANKQVLL